MGKTVTFNGRLRDALDCCRRLQTKKVKDGRDHVDCVRILSANFSLGCDSLGPMDDERIADTAAIGLAFPATERRVTCKGPAPGVVIERVRSTQLIDHREVLLERVRHVVEELVLVDRSTWATLGTRPVIRDEHDDGVVPLTNRLEEVEKASVV